MRVSLMCFSNMFSRYYGCFFLFISLVVFFFFFSSRRRHTRWNCDWSSDVCSSDLKPGHSKVLGRSPSRLGGGGTGRGAGAGGQRTSEQMRILRSALCGARRRRSSAGVIAVARRSSTTSTFFTDASERRRYSCSCVSLRSEERRVG